jgi:dTDP-4-amino-4,6-dideoxygalactose transaminase
MSSGIAFPEPLHVGRPNISDPERFIDMVRGALDRRWLSNDGPLVRELEARIADYVGAKHCVSITNGTIALEIAIRALGLSGEVIVPSFTFIATAHALHWQGITPVFADIDPETHCLDPASVERLITPRTTGVIGVHLWGRPAPVTALETVAREHGLALLYDAAHAFGVSVDGKMVGSFGDAEVFSFHATKFFNTLEGGAVVTDDDDIAHRARLMRNFGFVGEDAVASDGTNGKMSEISAAMGLVNLDGIQTFIDVNRRNHEAYTRELAGLQGVSVLPMPEGDTSNYQYVVLVVDPTCARGRDEILARLRAENVLARRYFWPGAHLMEPYRTLYPEAAQHLPVTRRIANSVIVLPTGTAVDLDDIRSVARIVRSACDGAS